ncbi:MAG TPA: RagB/SusD family nutrient uptake outer membrane protein [Gemmatimonadaceae bacterium]|nr:RagB/SusD family nutrient uptake outer membrane protein [Gemmatimonadaceae bacterium]
MKQTSRHILLVGAALPILLALGVYACDRTLTDAAEPQGTLDPSTISNAQGVEASLIATYRALDWFDGAGFDSWGWAASNWVWGSVTSDDAYKGSEASDQPGVTDIELYQWTTNGTDLYLNDAWKGAYEGISRANTTLRLLNDVQAQHPGEIPAADVAGIAGEAIFLRAHYHFTAWRMWANIPYFREEDTDFRKPNLDSAAVVAELLKDLDSAIAVLPDVPRGGSAGRVTRWTAQAYKGRVLAYAHHWPEALTTLREVRTGGPYALEPSYDHVWTGFPEFRNGSETILAYQATANDGDPDGNNANYGERLNFPHSGSPFGCCGFHQPSQNLVNFFAVDPTTGLPLALTDASWNASDAELEAGSPKAVDPRLDWTVGRDGVPYKDWGPHESGWIRQPAYGGPYSPKKNVHEKSSGAQSNVGWAPTQQNAVPIHIFRYADMLLLLAEAEVEAGSLENARTIVNEIRARAGARVQGPGVDKNTIAVPIDDPSITWANYKVGLYTTPWTSQDQARTAVRYERRLELAMEGQRFFDLRRWGTFRQVLNDYLAVESNRRRYLAAAAAVDERHHLYPIPSVQIELSKVDGQPQLTQNPGW